MERNQTSSVGAILTDLDAMTADWTTRKQHLLPIREDLFHRTASNQKQFILSQIYHCLVKTGSNPVLGKENSTIDKLLGFVLVGIVFAVI